MNHTTQNWKLNLYFIVMSLSGVSLTAYCMVTAVTWQPAPLLWTLLAFAFFASFVHSTSDDDIAHSLSLALAVATLGLLGAGSAISVAFVGYFGLGFLAKLLGGSQPLEALKRAVFTAGCAALSLLAAALVQSGLNAFWLFHTSIGQIATWIIIAFSADQLYLWLTMAYTARVRGFRPLQIWRANQEDILTNMAVTVVGSGLILLAVQEMDIVGLNVLCLPVLLAGYATTLYVRYSERQLRKLECLIEERSAQLAKVVSEKDAFLSILSHDMRTMLANIRLYASLLRDKTDIVPQKRLKLANVIMLNERNLGEIVDNIVEITNVDARDTGQVSLSYSVFDLTVLINEVTTMMAEQAKFKNIHLKYKAAWPRLILQGDQAKLRRVLQNLVSNAIKYTPNDGFVTVCSYFRGDCLAISVEDTGHGIPAADLGKIFDRFHRVEAHRNKARGTGLGLAIVRNLVEAHGGFIDVRSIENAGSTFTVQLPRSLVLDLPTEISTPPITLTRLKLATAFGD